MVAAFGARLASCRDVYRNATIAELGGAAAAEKCEGLGSLSSSERTRTHRIRVSIAKECPHYSSRIVGLSGSDALAVAQDGAGCA